MDSNRGPLVSEATALPTLPQPLPYKVNTFSPIKIIGQLSFQFKLKDRLIETASCFVTLENYKKYLAVFKGLISIWQTLEPTLENSVHFSANLH